MGAPLKIPSLLDRRASVLGSIFLLSFLFGVPFRFWYLYYLRPLWLDQAPKANSTFSVYAVGTAILFVIGICWSVHAARISCRRKKFGDSILELKNAPVPLGGVLDGTVTLGGVIQPENGISLKLVCIHHIVTHGRSDYIKETPLWEHSHHLQSGSTNSIPVSFSLPECGQVTHSVSPDDRTFWRLDVTAKMRDLNYAAQFELPVARVALNPAERSEAQKLRAAEAHIDENSQPPVNSRIRVRDTVDGKEFYLPAFRHPRTAVFLTVFVPAWTAFCCYLPLVGFKADPVFTRLIVLILPLWIESFVFREWIDECFVTRRVTANKNNVTVIKYYLGIGRTHIVPTSSIAKIKLSIEQSASLGSHVAYDIQVVGKYSRTLTAFHDLEDSQEAHWLALEIARCAGV